MKFKGVILMSVISSLLGCFTKDKDHSPYSDKSTNAIYNLIFSEFEYFDKVKSEINSYPWNIIFSKKPSEVDLKKIIADTDLESRIHLLAYEKMRKKNYKIESKKLLGIVIERASSNGLDTLAMYRDGSIRYINYTGKMIVWDNNHDKEISKLLNQIFSSSQIIVNQIGPWEERRKKYPTVNNMRLSFLVSDGLYFGEGPIDVLSNDKFAGPVYLSGAQILKYITEKALKK